MLTVYESDGVRVTDEFDLSYAADLAEVAHIVLVRAPEGARLVDRKVAWQEPPDPDDVSDEEFLAELLAYAAELRESGQRRDCLEDARPLLALIRRRQPEDGEPPGEGRMRRSTDA